MSDYQYDAQCEMWDAIAANAPAASQVCRDCGKTFETHGMDRDRCDSCVANALGESHFVVIENTPGYMPEDDDPATFDDYADAVAYLNERAAEYAEDPDGNYRVEYGIASSDNLAAVMVWDDDKSHDLGRVIAIVRDND